MPAPSQLLATFHLRVDRAKFEGGPARRTRALTGLFPAPINTSSSSILLLVQVTPSSAPVLALLDSGASQSHISAHLARKLGLPLLNLPRPIHFQGWDGRVSETGPVKQSTPLKIRIGPHLFDSGSLFVSPLGGSAELILGFDFLQQYCPFINWRGKWIYFPPQALTQPDRAVAAMIAPADDTAHSGAQSKPQRKRVHSNGPTTRATAKRPSGHK